MSGTESKAAMTVMLLALTSDVCLANLPGKGAGVREAVKATTMFPDGCAHDFGKVRSGEPITYTFRIVNTSDVPLQISSLRYNHCLVALSARLSTWVLKPHEEAQLQITLDTIRFRGRRTYPVYLETKGETTTVTAFSVTADCQVAPQP